MYSRVIEAMYPLGYRYHDAAELGKHLKHRHSVTIVGMKRVGISNFLRFFFSHPQVRKEYIKDKEKHVFIVVDLNDLIEREIFPFWTLVLKRITDTVERIEMPPDEKKKIENLFIRTIQINDHFVTLDNVRQAFGLLIENGLLPTLFLVHFDRIKEKVTPAFFDNLEGLLNASGNKLSFVFTSYRTLNDLSPVVFAGNPLPFYCENMYLKLAEAYDMETVFSAYNNRYELSLPDKVKEKLFQIVNGHIQYLQLSLLTIKEAENTKSITPGNLIDLLVGDERINLQSEEIWESLSDEEKSILLKVVSQEGLSAQDLKGANYLLETKIVEVVAGKFKIFSPLLEDYLKQFLLKQNNQSSTHFTKKENALFKLLDENLGEVCEREMIVNFVWPEYSESGISDWAIDRLVARVRTKLRQQKSKYEIKTIRTRGYQMQEK